MARSQEALLREISDCVLDFRDEDIADLVQEYIESGYDAREGVLHGLISGMEKASDLYEEGEYFLPELLCCSSVMYDGLNIFNPYLKSKSGIVKCKVAVGVIEGDTHDIGKNLVKIMLETSSYEVIDLGRDVPVEKFVEIVEKEDVKAIFMSSLMTTVMINMKVVVDMLTERGLRDKVMVFVGGAPITPRFAKEIGADGYSSTAIEAAELIDRMMGF